MNVIEIVARPVMTLSACAFTPAAIISEAQVCRASCSAIGSSLAAL